MTDNTKAYKPRQRKSKGPFSDDLLDQLLSQVQGKDAESLLGKSGLVGQLKKQLAERMLSAELSHHLSAVAPQGEAVTTATAPAPRPCSTPAGHYNSISRATASRALTPFLLPNIN